MKKTLFAVIVIMLLAGSACTSYERCMHKYGQTVTDTVNVFVEHIIPKDSVITHIHIDSIQYMIPGQVYEAESGRATIKYWKDKYSNLLMMQADCDSVVIRDTIRIPVTTTVFEPAPVKESKFKIFAKSVVDIIFWICIMLILISIVIVIIKYPPRWKR